MAVNAAGSTAFSVGLHVGATTVTASLSLLAGYSAAAAALGVLEDVLACTFAAKLTRFASDTASTTMGLAGLKWDAGVLAAGVGRRTTALAACVLG